MLTLHLTNAPQWCDLIPGVRVKLRPLTTALMVSARGDPAIAHLPEGAATEEAALAMAKALARLVVEDWEGVGDAEGTPVPVTPEGIDALLDILPLFEAFQLRYVSKGLLLEAEKNGSAPLPNGISAGATSIADPAMSAADAPAASAQPS